jgi:hypothetical protein
MRFSGIALASLIGLVMTMPAQVLAQNDEPYDVIKSKRSESFVIPYGAANHDRKDPVIYRYDEPRGQSWIMGIENTLSYIPDDDAKAVIVLREPAPSEKYIEITMYGGEARRYAVSANVPGTGYFNIYRNDQLGWSSEGPVGVTHVENSGLTVTDGRRIVIDRFDLDGFNLGSVEVYGKDEPTDLSNAYAGSIAFSLSFGSIADTPVYFVPAAVAIGVGALMGVLLYTKKRKP